MAQGDIAGSRPAIVTTGWARALAVWAERLFRSLCLHPRPAGAANRESRSGGACQGRGLSSSCCYAPNPPRLAT